jgi:iron complex outermembrane receptor protein
MRGTVKGIEAWGSLQLTPTWRLHAGFTRLLQHFSLNPGSNDTAGLDIAAGANPGRQVQLRSSMDLPRNTALDLTVRYVSALSAPEVPSYLTMDARLARRPSPGVELSLTGQNLVGPGHGEFTDAATRSELGRNIFATVNLRF